jgi:uncharacterized metal-binding protein
MNAKGKSAGPATYKMVFACSGASDVGEITDLAARKLNREKAASMCCVAAIGANIEDIVEKARGASWVVALDGCSKNCAKIILGKGGFEDFGYVQLEEMGLEKGESPASNERVEQVAARARAVLKDKQ